MQQQNSEEFIEPDKIQIGYLVEKTVLWSEITGIVSLFHACFERIMAVDRKKKIEKLFNSFDWFEHHLDKVTGRRVLSETALIEHQHE